ncbi:MAG: hypothetical protein FWD53_06965 [Phycisphaerales bacterium]|nr:hypothetical protein [Phycisphaerales bacterium]
MIHTMNWYGGWAMLLTSFAVGAIVGLSFWRENFMGGYGSWRRRMVRLGHIALAALGILNMVYGLAGVPVTGTWQAQGAGMGLLIGGVAMPTVCFLAAWRMDWRHGFVIPVCALVGAAVCVLMG